KQYHIQVQGDPARMRGQGVSLSDLMAGTADALDTGELKFARGAAVGSLGFVETANQRLGVRNIQPITTPAQLASVPLARRGELAIPRSLAAAAIVLDATGSTVNTMILAGFAVAVGVVVDDAIIDMENIVRRLRLWRSQGKRTTPLRLVLAASLEVRVAILYA